MKVCAKVNGFLLVKRGASVGESAAGLFLVGVCVWWMKGVFEGSRDPGWSRRHYDSLHRRAMWTEAFRAREMPHMTIKGRHAGMERWKISFWITALRALISYWGLVWKSLQLPCGSREGCFGLYNVRRVIIKVYWRKTQIPQSVLKGL